MDGSTHLRKSVSSSFLYACTCTRVYCAYVRLCMYDAFVTKYMLCFHGCVGAYRMCAHLWTHCVCALLHSGCIYVYVSVYVCVSVAYVYA